MNMKRIVQKQYRENVNRARAQLVGLTIPSEGWIRTVRQALGMSGAQLARRMGVTRGLVSNTEKAELAGGVTIKAMQNMAHSMNCRFVYAIVPEHDIEEIVQKRALEKARAQVKQVSVHMALEEQALSEEKLREQVQSFAEELLKNSNSDLWNDE
ncbi:MAG: mobile mystery protein A [Alcanivorax sp.]|jgi:predicted DNA-binding mobile mystery protein A|nr:MAG: transcriptional regulator [Oceanobacter sp.]|tara:strand:- start:742 stop:1206 length:465 start_codon:yes stop_codon:yes gene_type:complete